MKFVGWAMLAVPLLIIAYSGYQYLYFSGVISTPLLPPSLAAKQPSHREDYAMNVVIATFFGAVVVGINLYGRHREKRARGFEVLKKEGGGPSAE